MVSRQPYRRIRRTSWQTGSGCDSQVPEPSHTRCCFAGIHPALKSQRAYVVHVLECIGRIEEDLRFRTRDSIWLTLSKTPFFGIFRSFASLFGESTRHRRTRTLKSTGKAIAGMRNVLVHDYFEVDFESIWNVVTRDLVPLQSVMHTILARLNESD